MSGITETGDGERWLWRSSTVGVPQIPIIGYRTRRESSNILSASETSAESMFNDS